MIRGAVAFTAGRAWSSEATAFRSLMARKTHIALLRGINVAGQHKVPMVELRAAFANAGCDNVQTYIQSGNVVFESAAPAARLEERLENAVEPAFGFSVPVIVRPVLRWRSYIEQVPFPDQAEQEGNRVLLAASKRPPSRRAAAALQQRATLGERVVATGGVVWIYYRNGIGQSKLTPAVLDRHVGSPVTGRNWRTVVKLDEMARQLASG